MAKYRLTKNPRKSVNCEVLQENLNGYIVRFDNGMIKNVNKRNVYAFDRIDEAVLNEGFIDDVKDGLSKFGKSVVSVGKKIAKKIKDFFVDVFRVGDVVVFTDNRGKVLKASHPVNAIAAAKQYKGISVIPSESVLSVCEDTGIEPEAVEYEYDDNQYEGSLLYTLMVDNNVNESYRGKSVLKRLYEARNGGSDTNVNIPQKIKDMYDVTPAGIERIFLQTGTSIDRNAFQLGDELLAKYVALREGIRNEDSTTSIYLILGAPGVGKSAAVEQLKKQVAKLEYTNELGEKEGITTITINANSITSDAFTLPANSEQVQRITREYKSDDTIRHHIAEKIKQQVIKDLPKTWLPVYDRTETKQSSGGDIYNFKNELISTEVYLNAIANGGRLHEAADGKTKIVNGPGGVFFIDEYLRMQPFAKDSLMSIASSRTIGQNLVFGDRWFICAAANRYSDMSVSALQEAFYPEAADEMRIDTVNFVPTVNEWLEWGSKVNKKTERLNIYQEIMDYINETSSAGATYKGFYDVTKLSGKSFDYNKPKLSPRTWEAYSEKLAEMCLFRVPADKRKELSLIDILQNDSIIIAGQDPNDKRTKLDAKLAKFEEHGAGIIGERGAKGFVDYLRKRCKTMTATIAKELYFVGPYATELTEDAMLYVTTTISSTAPDVMLKTINNVMVPFLKKQNVNVTKEGLINIIKCLAYCIEASSNRSNVNLKDIWEGLSSTFAGVWPMIQSNDPRKPMMDEIDDILFDLADGVIKTEDVKNL